MTKMEVGTLFQYKELVLEVCKAEDLGCRGCVALGKNGLCKKLPVCYTGVYYRKLNSFQIRKAKKDKLEIRKL
ncbi:hypothetical protein [Dysgonomonas sp. ZJ709]|uniref:hypothetical protein n=1 Tax=Dysgonomonas sp. ZJ709 TaxID=2709797 RepID=UPI0013EB038D|nr:hypothetical protein [Dysgonomonas sp. ZJ709]